MSIVSSICADSSNEIKETWQKELRVAYEIKSWDAVKVILEEIETFRFSE